MTTGGYTLLTPPRPRQKLVHIHASAEELGRVYQADLAINATMNARAPRSLERSRRRRRCRWAGVDRGGARRLRGQPACRTPVAPLDMADDRAAASTATCRHDAILTNGAGNFASWVHRFYRYHGLRQAATDAARADLGRDGLRRAGGASPRRSLEPGAPWSPSPATATS